MDVKCVECLKKFSKILESRTEFLQQLIDSIKKNPDNYCAFRHNKSAYMKLIKTLGLKREFKVLNWLTDAYPDYQGYRIVHVRARKGDSEPDFIIYDKNNVPVMVVEVKNYGEKTYMIESTFQNTIEKFSKYNCFKLLILSTGYNLIRKTIKRDKSTGKEYTYTNTNLRKTSEYLRSKGIYTWILGYQDLMNIDDLDNIVAYIKKKTEYPNIEGWLDASS